MSEVHMQTIEKSSEDGLVLLSVPLSWMGACGAAETGLLSGCEDRESCMIRLQLEDGRMWKCHIQEE
jgi:hypothetical protein